MKHVVALIDAQAGPLKKLGPYKARQSNAASDNPMHVVTPEWLFERAGILVFGAVEWGLKPSEHGPGVYVITSAEPPDLQTIVYIGRSKHLSKRLGQFYRHKYGERSPHRGGQEILNLPGKRLVYWAAVADYAGTENIMLDAFRSVAGVWPFGNRMKSAAMARISN